MSGMCGGTGPSQDATEEAQQIANHVRDEVETKEGSKFNEFTVESFRTQTVAGRNYFLKVRTGDDQYVHLRVYQDLTGQISLARYLSGKKKDDELEYF